MADLPALAARGLGEKIVALAAAGVPVVGICGGFQILGREVRDPHGIEGAAGGVATGLGLLPVTNVLEREKTLTRATALHAESGLTVRGYEIHHGQLAGEGWEPGITRADGETVGVSARGGAVWGTYLHGIFDDDAFRRWFVDGLRRRRGLAPLGTIVAIYDLEAAFDRLAATVRENIDLKAVMRLVGLA
jgi:adenosylcobyric acid synthase